MADHAERLVLLQAVREAKQRMTDGHQAYVAAVKAAKAGGLDNRGIARESGTTDAAIRMLLLRESRRH